MPPRSRPQDWSFVTDPDQLEFLSWQNDEWKQYVWDLWEESNYTTEQRLVMMMRYETDAAVSDAQVAVTPLEPDWDEDPMGFIEDLIRRGKELKAADAERLGLTQTEGSDA